MTKLVVKSEIIINAPAAKVWDALTKPEQTKKYMFGCETVSDWKAGSELLWRGSYEGKEMVFVKGRIVEIKSPSLLKYTVIDPNASYPDIPENHLNVTYEVNAQGNQTKLVVTQDGFEGAAEGEKRYKDTYNNGEGWNPILVQIKKIAEEN
ncbi:MAG TPA: SRPBCC domain-containing protein [Bacteroidia bacterium]|jgi:uncharacterized protein YndB with AHSA1/START domain|nr:SRPBCC domain-containing protein [Bacteroidia bacterium]